ncbi:MAG: hypothetical protein ISR83_05020 [Candidatus Marinimicrobia bacterium]|nr:hypothetical protein [Candidatus Neomarinimicrobiota bacterium]
MSDKNISALLQVLNSEQQITARTDQKAFTMLSILGVFMVFFIVHFLKLQMNWFIFAMVLVYFSSALMAIIHLVMVIVPRVRKVKSEVKLETDKDEQFANPTFFGGISQFKDADTYASYLKSISETEDKIYEMFAAQVFSLGKINAYKNTALRRSIFFFVSAILSELMIIMSMAWARAAIYLFPPS